MLDAHDLIHQAPAECHASWKLRGCYYRIYSIYTIGADGVRCAEKKEIRTIIKYSVINYNFSSVIRLVLTSSLIIIYPKIIRDMM